MIDKFCDWFEGEFDNWTQAASNPTKWAHIIVKHEKIDEYNIIHRLVIVTWINHTENRL